MGIVPTPKLAELAGAWNRHRIVEVPGPFSSSKTYMGMHVYSAWAMHRFEGALFGLAAHSDSQIQDVLIEAFEEQWWDTGIRLRPRKHGWEFPTDIPGGRPNRFIRLLGGRRDGLDRIRGKNLQGLFIDEFPDLAGPDMVKMLISRVRLPGAKVMLTHNPQHLHHWSHTELLQVLPDVGKVQCTIYDNPKNPPWYIDNLIATYPPGTAGHDRYVLGQPTLLSHHVFGGCEVAYLPAHPTGVADSYDIVIDVGLSDYTHALLFGGYGGVPVVLDEWGNSGTKDGMMRGIDCVTATFGKFAKHPRFWSRIRSVLVDPAAIDFRLEVRTFLERLRRKHGVDVTMIRTDKPGKRKGRDVLRWYLTNQKVTISPKAEKLKHELSNLMWDQNKADQGEDEPVKGSQHGIHAATYYVWNWHLASSGRANTDSLRRMAGGGDWREASNRMLTHRRLRKVFG